MIRFFRNIRQKLAAENKVAKYLRYAIGEILLVVIGILIALQINNWNENRKNAAVEKEIISNLNDEFQQNKLIHNELSDILLKSNNSCYQLMNLMNKEKNFISNYNIDSLIYWSIEFASFNPSNNVLTEILQSGRSGLIKNKKLINSLFDWQQILDNNNKTFYIYQKFIEEQIIPYLSNHISFKNIDKYGPMQWKNSTEFKTNVHKIFADRKFENLIDNNLYHLSL